MGTFPPPFSSILHSQLFLKRKTSLSPSLLSLILSFCHTLALRDSSTVFAGCCRVVHLLFTFYPMEASRASGGKNAIGGVEVQGCGVWRGPHRSGQVGDESLPTLEELGESLPSLGRSQVLKRSTQPLRRSRTWSSIQPRLGLGSSSGLGNMTTSCSAGLSSTCRLYTYPLPIDLGLIIHKR